MATPSALRGALLATGAVSETADSLSALRDGFAVACIRPQAGVPSDAPFETLLHPDLNWRADEVLRRQAAWLRGGIALWRSEFDALANAGAALLVPESEESRLLREGADPLKVF